MLHEYGDYGEFPIIRNTYPIKCRKDEYFIMDYLLPIKNTIDAVLRIMAEREYAITTIRNQQFVFNTLLKFMEENNFTELNEEIAMVFIKKKQALN